MFTGEKNRSVIDDDGECKNSRSVMRWTNSNKAIENRVTTVTQLIDIRESCNQSIGFASQELGILFKRLLQTHGPYIIPSNL